MTSVVSSLRARRDLLTLTDRPESPTAITVRVQMPELWETIAVRCEPDTPVLALKRAALKAFGQHDYPATDYVLKLRGFEVVDESAPVSVADARDGSIFLLTYRWRRPVR